MDNLHNSFYTLIKLSESLSKVNKNKTWMVNIDYVNKIAIYGRKHQMKCFLDLYITDIVENQIVWVNFSYKKDLSIFIEQLVEEGFDITYKSN